MGSSGKNVGYLVAVVIISLAAIVLSAAAFGTDYWITINHTQSENITFGSYYINFNMGLFKGHTNMQNGQWPFTIKEYRSYPDFMNFGLYVSTLLFVALGIVFSIVTAIFSIVNSFTTPIEEITGIRGLYMWNNLACLFTLAGLLMYVGEFVQHFKFVLLALEDEIPYSLVIPNDYDEVPSSLGYSFYLVVASTVLLILNNLPIFLSTYKVDMKKQLPSSMDNEITADGAIMLY